MSRVGIVAALAAEARALCPRSPRRGVPTTLEDGTLLAVSGIGMVAATAAAFALMDAGADALVSFGLAGGLDPTLPAGTIFLPTEIIDTHEQALPTSPEWHGRVGKALASSRLVVRGKLLSTPRAIAEVRDKADAFHTTGAFAVDMESIAVGRAAASRGLPFLVVRVIVDTATDVLPPALMAASETGQLRVWRLIGWLVLAPANIVVVLRLARRYHVASRALRAAASVRSLREAVIG